MWGVVVGRGRVHLRRSEWNACIFCMDMDLERLNFVHGLGVKMG
jgi:alkylhydroperoxidase family enzyme